MKICVIGGGYSGLILCYQLLKSVDYVYIDWISSEFNGGDIISYWKEVTSNTPWKNVK